MSEHLYAASSAATGNGADSNGGSGSSNGGAHPGTADEVIDVEFEKAK